MGGGSGWAAAVTVSRRGGDVVTPPVAGRLKGRGRKDGSDGRRKGKRTRSKEEGMLKGTR